MKLTQCFLAPLFLASTLATAAVADDRAAPYDYGDRRSSDSRSVDRRDLRGLAHDLEGYSRAAYHEAQRQLRDRHQDRYRELDAVSALDRLADQARRFRQEVDRGRDRGRAERAWDALERAYYDASASLRGAGGDRRIRDLFGRVRETMGDVAHYYGGSRRDDWRTSDRSYDRDRYHSDRDRR